MKRKLLIIGAAAVTLAGTAACGGEDGTAGAPATGASTGTAASQASHNRQDVTFAQMMIPHHRQAVQMSDMVIGKTRNAEVKALAEKIKKAQAPEIETMTGWLRQWGAEVPPEQGGDSGHGDQGSGHGGHGGHEMPGMMTPAQMAEMEKATGAGLDRMFLTMMIEHHEGAVAMAEDEQAKGAYPAAKAMAGTIIRTQRQEITEMRALLK
ncbi:DUF305 domain-containing protein [Spirillospora sp. NPDC029432]|uniref:DUF305 domain-containing protein n=1 Tax=Spirillospora sp. NPDC029432 TaxID=3154599 RepID=UPI003451C7A8